MLTHISIENFKGIRDRVEIELKPITLLFGPNSAGKSTILHALLYAQEVFERHNLNADTTAAGGPYVNLGGFGQMVYEHDLKRAIKLGFRFKLDDGDFLPYQHDEDELQMTTGVPKSAGVEVAIGWSKHREPFEPFVMSCLLQLDGSDFAKIVFDDNSNERRLQLLYLDHPLFTRDDGELSIYLSGGHFPLQGHYPYERTREANDVSDEDPLLCAESASTEGRSILRAAFEEIERRFLSGNPSASEEGFLLPCRENDDALPSSNTSVTPSDTLFFGSARTATEDHLPKTRPVKCLGAKGMNVSRDMHLQRLAFNVSALLDNLITNTLDALRKRLRDFRYLGPVREIPSRNAKIPSTPDPARWSTGLGAWDRLHTCDLKFVKQVSAWLAQPEHLNVGVRLERRDLLPFDSDRGLLADLPLGTLTPRKLSKRLAKLQLDRHVFLVPSDSEIELSLHDVGVGLSQLVPVVVTVLDSGGRLAGIEEPAYHLHPRLQAELGDLLIESAAGNNAVLLIETHSEHILLRIQRRIRETRQERTPPKRRIDETQVAVYYVQRCENGSKMTRLKLDGEGDFVDEWPDGFFPERLNELR